MMRVMKENKITPFTFSGMQHYYRLAFLRALWASYEGLNDFMLNDTTHPEFLKKKSATVRYRNGLLFSFD